MRSWFRRINNLSVIASNRIIYGALLIAACAYAWSSGHRLAYICVVVLFLLPVVSYIITLAILMRLKVWQDMPDIVIKTQHDEIIMRLHNPAPLPLNQVACIFVDNEPALEIEKDRKFALAQLKTSVTRIPFYARYRGYYQTGLIALEATDLMKLFRLRRNYKKQTNILVLPRILENSDIPIAANIMSEASSRFDIRDEDYATISDVRPYIPTDSIKRVHWKLTAKRNEWLVKIFQSNALNLVTVILDNSRLDFPKEETHKFEDQIVENAIALMRFCLGKGMPIDFLLTDGSRAHAQTVANFDTIYHIAGSMTFEEKPALTPTSILQQILNDATGYVNAVIFTAKLDVGIYERVVNALERGHHAAVIYVAPKISNYEYDKIFALMVSAGLPCYRMIYEEE